MTGASPTSVDVGEHCLVEGKIEDRESVNGRYGIRFQLRMPVGWNGRFLFQGLADPIFSAKDIARWYEQTSKDTGNDVAQLFMVPGMTHCGGGPAFEDFDSLTALEQWKDSGEKPTVMVAKAPTMPEREMPLCAYPTYAKYTGGDKNEADSYQCVAL